VPARISEPLGRSNTGTLSTTTGVSEMGTGVGGVWEQECARVANGVRSIHGPGGWRILFSRPRRSDPDPPRRRATSAPLWPTLGSSIPASAR